MNDLLLCDYLANEHITSVMPRYALGMLSVKTIQALQLCPTWPMQELNESKLLFGSLRSKQYNVDVYTQKQAYCHDYAQRAYSYSFFVSTLNDLKQKMKADERD